MVIRQHSIIAFYSFFYMGWYLYDYPVNLIWIWVNSNQTHEFYHQKTKESKCINNREVVGEIKFMAIFNIQNSKLSVIREKSIDLERYIQNITEQNLEII